MQLAFSVTVPATASVVNHKSQPSQSNSFHSTRFATNHLINEWNRSEWKLQDVCRKFTGNFSSLGLSFMWYIVGVRNIFSQFVSLFLQVQTWRIDQWYMIWVKYALRSTQGLFQLLFRYRFYLYRPSRASRRMSRQNNTFKAIPFFYTQHVFHMRKIRRPKRVVFALRWCDWMVPSSSSWRHLRSHFFVVN